MIFVIALLLVRIVLAQNLQRRFTPERNLISPFWLVPVKDLLQAAIWFCAFTGNTVEWRGRKMKLRRDGTLVEEKIKLACRAVVRNIGEKFGVGPSSFHYDAAAFVLRHAPNEGWWAMRDSNPRPSPCKGAALPLRQPPAGR